MAVRILIADDNPSVRQAVREALDRRPDWEVCGAAIDGLEAVELTAALNPDLVILDLSMPRMNGFQAARAIRSAAPRLPILLLTQYPIETQIETGAREAGFGGAVTKGSFASLLRAIESLLQGKTFFESPVSKIRPQAE